MDSSKNDKSLKAGVDSGLSHKKPMSGTNQTGQKKMEGIPDGILGSTKAGDHTIK